MPEDTLIPIGRIVGTHGIKGCFKALSFAESTAFFEPGGHLSLRRKGKQSSTFRIVSASGHKRGILLSLEGIASMDAAKEWVGSELCIDRTALPELEAGLYYWHEMIGMAVFTMDGRPLGRLEAIWPTGANDVYVVCRGEKTVLIPAIDSVVIEINLNEGTMRVDLPEGLEE